MKGDSMTKTATVDALSVSGAYPAVDELDGTRVFRLGYDGASFSGFAEQPEGLRTVAGEVRRALETFLRRPVDLTCAGRTDAGVHAVSQYVSIPAHADELAITHATRSVTWWHRLPLDMDTMELAAASLVGEHDFKSFCKTSSAIDKPTCRNVIAVSFERASALGEEHIAFTITGNAFLHSMVRTIVGSLVEVGAGRRDERWLSVALAACDRRAAGPTAPARGLCFRDDCYDEGAVTPCP